MVRIRLPPRLADGILRQPTRKRKSGESTNNANGIPSNGGGAEVARTSKRTRTSQMPYQSPESVDVLISAEAKGRRNAAKNKNEVTPAKTTKRETGKALTTPKKPIKRLQGQKSVRKLVPKLPVRRKLMKSFVPPKSKGKGKSPRANTDKVAKKLGKVGKIVTKAKATVASKAKKVTAVDSSGPQKRKLPKGKAQKDEPPAKVKLGKVLKGKKGRLVPRPELTQYDNDPTFETRQDIPFISTIAHSRLIIRAIILNDLKMLKRLIHQEPEKIYSLAVPRSYSHDETPFDYICKSENKEAFNILYNPPQKVYEKFGPNTTMMVSEETTGRPSHMMFGHAMRQVSVGRGGKEGNNAFLHDFHNSYYCPKLLASNSDAVDRAIQKGCSAKFVEFLKTKFSLRDWEYTKAHVPLRLGRHDIAGQIIAQANQRGGYGFNFLHEEVLTKSSADELTPFKPVSVTKKSTYDPRMAPLHCAAVNPNGEILAELLRSMPDYNLVDKDMWSVGHYAAVCSGPEPLKHLLQFGISTHAITSPKRGGDGYTLLHAAVVANRPHNVKLILENEKKMEQQKKDNAGEDQNEEVEDPKRKQKVLIQNDIRYKLATNGKNALQMACELGHAEIVKLLLEAETDPNKQTPAKQDSVTPLMLAAMHGHLEIAKLLVDAGVKVDAKDKRGRTAVHHAAMNGHCHILSYLLRLGANALALDSSGNSLLHYTAAYGWYFATLLALEAGCPPNGTNHWKFTPMAITFMKGHIGLVTVLMKQDGVDVNAKIDDGSGKTLLLETCSNGWDLSRLKFLVEELKADPTCEDFNGNNALHFLTKQRLEDRYSDFPEKSKAFYECISYLINRGCDPLKKNIDGMSPILLAAQRQHFYFISKLLELGIRIPFEKDDAGNTLLHYMSQNLNCQRQSISPLFTKLCTGKADTVAIKEMAATHNDEGFTPLLALIKCNISFTYDQDLKKEILKMVDIYFDKLGVNVNKKVEGKDKSQMTLLHYTVGTYLMTSILKQKPQLDPLDDKSRTPLIMAVINGQREAAEELINAGANVKTRFKEEHNISLLLYSAMKEERSFSLIPKLIEKGADPHEIHPKTKNSILHYIARKPMVHFAAAAMKVALNNGVRPDLVNCNGRTALHMAINARGTETDVFYDIEDVLISAKASLTIRDERGRIPLHYCFVKQGKPIDSTFFDPIELVSTIVATMKSNGLSLFIHQADVYGSTALHYAAFRGSTICCSYLIQTLPSGGIDICDNNGNTPFGLAVRNAHEGCALNLFQKDADFLRKINNDIKVIEMRTEQARLSSSRIKTPQQTWKWNRISEQEADQEKLNRWKQQYPILEQIVKNDWQGLLYLMIGQLQASGTGFSTGISTALKLHRLKLALKIAMKVKDKKELMLDSGTLFHCLAKHHQGTDLEITTKICEAFLSTGLNPAALDEFGSQAVIYALANQQISLCQSLYGSIQNSIKPLATIKPDKFGRTPFTALFWNQNGMDLILLNPTLQPFAAQLISAGLDPNLPCEYPINLSSLPGLGYTKKVIDIVPSSSAPRYPPLILAVIVKCYTTVKWLLTEKKTGALKVDINAQDSEGRTALMHAVRLNDIKMVKMILDPQNYKHTEDAFGLQKIKVKSTNVDLTIRDKKGWTVFDYLMMSPRIDCFYKNIKDMFEFLQLVQPLANITSGDGLKPLDKAVKYKRNDLVEILSKNIPPQKRNHLPEQYSSFTPVFSQDITVSSITDYPNAAEKMAEKLLEQEREKRRKKGKDDDDKPKPDPLCGLDKDNSELMIDEKLNIPYDILMTKVDISYGIHGLYNFYKMQLVKQPRGKEMILLFTEWGRVGQEGQYQKTPFATAEEAIKEFEKIFKQKSGNAWESVQNFAPISGKYRLVKRDLRTLKHSTQVAVDFKELEKAGRNVRSLVAGRILGLMRSLSGVHKDIAGAYGSRRYGIRGSMPDYCDLPLLPKDILIKAEDMLKQIGDRIAKKAELENKGTAGKQRDQEITQIMEDIVKLSEEFYQLIPVYGFATQNLEPIFDDYDIRQKVLAISRLIHLESAKALLLGAQYNMDKTNPYEYIYRCLGTKIQMLDRSQSRDSEEAELILQYIHNTGDRAKVFGIYRVEIPGQDAKLNGTDISNRKMLWHGTSSANMLSILQNGLQVAPLSAEISGHLFGKGIYLADIFEKSQHYCRSVKVNGKSRKFMLLCEAALGKIYEVKLSDAGEKPMPKTCNSLKTSDSRYEPDPESTVTWKGRELALGKKKDRPKPKGKENDYWYFGLDFNEYIVFNTDQVAIRYLIEFDEGDKVDNEDEDEDDNDSVSS